MSVFIESLYEACKASPFGRKIVLAPRFSDGQQWLAQLCSQYGSMLNVQVQTVEGLALKQTALSRFEQNKQYISPQQSFWIVHQLMAQLAASEDACISKSMMTPGMVSCVHRSVIDLREAMVVSSALKKNQFIDEQKGSYLIELLRGYEQMLEQRGLVDLASLAGELERKRQTSTTVLTALAIDKNGDAAVSSTGKNDANTPEQPSSDVYLLPDPMHLTEAERRIVHCIAGDRLVLVKRDAPFVEASSGFPAKDAELFHATGALAEVREVLRRMTADGIPLDQTEIIASNYEAYAGAVHALASEIGMPCTFAGGLPLEYSRVGRTLLQALSWLENDVPVAGLAAMLRSGGLSFRSADESVSTSEWIRCLGRLNIGWGTGRYLELIEPQDGTDDKEKAQFETLHSIFKKLFAKLPSAKQQWSPAAVLNWLYRLTDQYGVLQNEDDALAVKALKEMQETIGSLAEAPMSKSEALQYAKQLLSGIRTKVSAMPAPGAIHIASLSSGGVTGRTHTFIVGMDEHSWSAATRQDPVLLDEERARISEALRLSGEKGRMAKAERSRNLSLIRGRVTLSYSSYQLSGGKSASPAFELLQVYRSKSGQPDVDYSAMQRALGMPVGYLAANRSRQLDASDVWAGELTDRHERLKAGKQAMEQSYPFAGQGASAKHHRSSATLTEYDGWVAASLPVADEADIPRSISATQLERYASCGLKYYFSYVLGMWPKEETVYDRTRWLQPAERGNLLHRIFCDYLKQATKNGTEAPQHNKAALLAITEGLLSEYERLIPAPSTHIRQKEADDIRLDIEWFYSEEVSKTTLPRFFEQELTSGGEPLLLKLEDGTKIRMKGFVDRIDWIGPNQYRIIDYKTGSPSRYKENEYLAGGTQLQHALYALAAEQWIKESGIDSEASVLESAYYFPTAKGIGRETVRLQNKRGELARAVSGLLRSMEQGVFIPTSEPSRCRYCEYAAVCGDHASYMEEKKHNPDHAALLQSLLEVESID